MNSRQRVMATIAGQPTDRRPFAPVLSLYGSKLIGCPLETYYNDADAYVRGQIAVKETFGPDILYAPFFSVGEGQAFGSKIGFFDHQPPNMIQPAINSADQIGEISIPDIDSSTRLMYFRQALRNLVDRTGKTTPVAAIMLNPVDLPLMIMGIDAWLDTVLFDQDGVKRVLEVTIPFFVKWANTLLSEGADFLVMPCPFLNPSIVIRQVAEQLTLPVLRQVYAQVNGPIIVHHAGAPFLEFLGLFGDLPNVAGFAVDHTDSLAESRNRIGKDKVLLGGLDGPNVCRATPGQIQDRCTKILTDRKDDPKFILITTGADVALSTPDENIHAIRTAVETFGNGS